MPYDLHTRLEETEKELQQTKIQMEMYKKAYGMMQTHLTNTVADNTCLRQDLKEALARAETFEKDYNILLNHLRQYI